ncbi:hypothetical protein SARC_14205, partial [Sphaeroforma arctica JP610]
VYFQTGEKRKFSKKGQAEILLGPSLNTVDGSMRINNTKTKRIVNTRDYSLDPTVAGNTRSAKSATPCVGDSGSDSDAYFSSVENDMIKEDLERNETITVQRTNRDHRPYLKQRLLLKQI